MHLVVFTAFCYYRDSTLKWRLDLISKLEFKTCVIVVKRCLYSHLDTIPKSNLIVEFSFYPDTV